MNQECTCKWARECVWVSGGNYNLFCFVGYLSAAPQLCALKDTNEKKDETWGNIKVSFHSHESFRRKPLLFYLPPSLIHKNRKLCTCLRVKIIKSLCVLLCKDDSFCSLSSNRLVLGKQEKQLITMSSVVAPTKQRKTRNGRKKIHWPRCFDWQVSIT